MHGNGAVVVRLDTTAPVATWGGAGGTMAGELLVVGYTLDEPSALAARLVLANGTLDLDVFPDRVQGLLPPDAPSGLATIELDVEDDVGNAATRTHVLLLGGTAAPDVETGGLPRPPRRARPPRRIAPEPATKAAPSRVRTSSSSSIVAHNATVEQVRTRVATYVVSGANHTRSADSSRSVPTSLTTARVRAYAHTVTVSRSASDRRHRDDPALVALLLVD